MDNIDRENSNYLFGWDHNAPYCIRCGMPHWGWEKCKRDE